MFGRCNVRTSSWPFDDRFARVIIESRGAKRGFHGAHAAMDQGEFSPRIDVSEDAQGMTVTAELPGVAKEDLLLHVQDGVLEIAGEKKRTASAAAEDQAGFEVSERAFGKFERHLTLPRGIQTDAIDAQLQDGVLTVRFQKAPAVAPRTIAVN